MAVGDAQYRTGYTKGIKGAVIEVLDTDGSAVTPTPTRYGIRTPQEIGYEFNVVEGAEDQLRGGDIILINVKENDVIVSAKVTITNAKFDCEATYHIAGGTLVTEEIDSTDYNNGWEFPTIAEQATRTPFKLELYIQNFNSSGQQDSYMQVNFWFGKGYMTGVEHADQEWGTPELEIVCEENGAQTKSIMDIGWTDSLPTELTS